MHDSHEHASAHGLSDREQLILRSVVQSFILTADPVGSRTLARHYVTHLSPASIRNTMSDLEEAGFLDHPYTSAGRVPTQRGYRAFVDELMGRPSLGKDERDLLAAEFSKLQSDRERMLRESARLLGRMTNLLAVVLSPGLSDGVLQKLEVVELSSTRLMFIISVKSGLVRTIVMEVESELRRDEVAHVVRVLNERLAGLSLEDIRKTFARRVEDLADDSGLIGLVMRESEQIFNGPLEERAVRFGGAKHIVGQPEFQQPDAVRTIIELLENEQDVVRLLEQQQGDAAVFNRAVVAIGAETRDDSSEKFSVVTAQYRMGGRLGTIGVLGPMRMDYARVIALVEHATQVFGGREDAEE